MSTAVGLVHLNLHVAQAMSLKDKRRIIKSFKVRMTNGYNVSIAEVGGLDSHRNAVLAVAMVGNDKQYVEGALQRIVNAASSHRDMILVDHEVQWL
jgi:hypothetical protein